ncbi:MAG: phosphomethylpyrimidine synthase ThiC [Candidatus Cloacimonadota bacterium]|nr:MAG: phosphomethylpyrimidine synthase ThiC [Candidatus Cloacimonadota bacterium]
METIKEKAARGIITDEMKIVAKEENHSPEYLMKGIADGTIVIPFNKKHTSLKNIKGIGKGLKVKINANIGTSPYHMDLKEEIEKLEVALEFGTDSVMDLSLGSILKRVRKEIINKSAVMVGTVPIYQVGFELSRKKKNIEEMKIDDFLDVLREQAEDGVDFMTIHSGITLEAVNNMETEGRLLDIVSRGGAFLVKWMKKNREENPLYTYYDEILSILKEYDVTISIGDGMRPGAVLDSTDRGQIQELISLGELAQRAWDAGVQVIIEGPGHIPLNEIEANVLLEKKLCHGAPFYVLGPIVTDIAPGYDHITGAIGGALAALYGADFLCYVTPSEHLKLPDTSDVKLGVIASKIAAHATNIVRGKDREWDRKMADSRKRLNWKEQIELSLDSEKAREQRESSEIGEENVCTMCGEYCAIKQIIEAEQGQ